MNTLDAAWCKNAGRTKALAQSMEDEEVREALKRQGVTITFDHEDNNSSFDATDLRLEMKALT
jgi:hypothetical protein